MRGSERRDRERGKEGKRGKGERGKRGSEEGRGDVLIFMHHNR